MNPYNKFIGSIANSTSTTKNKLGDFGTTGIQSLIPIPTKTTVQKAPISNAGATSTVGTSSPAKSAYVQSLSSAASPTINSSPSINNPNPAIPGGIPEADPKASYRSSFESYINSLKPSDEESRASKNLSALSLQAERDQEEALNRGETLGFASGEAARVNRNNSFGIRAASDTLSALSGSRAATTDAQKARLDFEKSLLGDESEAANTKFDQDLATKKFEEDKRQYGLNYALKQKNLALDTYKASQSGSSANTPNVEQAKAQQFATAAGNANNILDTLNFNPSYLFDSKNLGFNGLKSEDRQKFEQASRAVVNAILRRESGATINDDEFQNKYKEIIPLPGDGDAVKKQKASARAAAIASIANAGGSGFSAPTQSSTSQEGDEIDTWLNSF